MKQFQVLILVKRTGPKERMGPKEKWRGGRDGAAAANGERGRDVAAATLSGKEGRESPRGEPQTIGRMQIGSVGCEPAVVGWTGHRLGPGPNMSKGKRYN